MSACEQLAIVGWYAAVLAFFLHYSRQNSDGA
jgi:hypothetical protein